MTFEAITLDDLAVSFLRGPDPYRPVVNKTGITGPFVFRLVIEEGDNFARVLKSQFGLDLRPANGPRRFLVIDHVERPTPNDASAISNTPRRAGGTEQ